MSPPVPCESCGAPGCDPVQDRCGCQKVICSRCMDDPRLWHIKGGAHRLLKDFPNWRTQEIRSMDQAAALGLSLIKLVVRIAKFQREKFPRQPIEGKCEHLILEAKELREAPTDAVENADCLILTLGINTVNGRTIEDLICMAHAKMDVCEQRSWGEADADGVHRHIEEAQ